MKLSTLFHIARMGDLAGGRYEVAADAGAQLGGGGDRPAPAAETWVHGGQLPLPSLCWGRTMVA